MHSEFSEEGMSKFKICRVIQRKIWILNRFKCRNCRVKVCMPWRRSLKTGVKNLSEMDWVKRNNQIEKYSQSFRNI